MHSVVIKNEPLDRRRLTILEPENRSRQWAARCRRRASNRVVNALADALSHPRWPLGEAEMSCAWDDRKPCPHVCARTRDRRRS